MNISHRIAFLREKRGWMQEQLANSVGITRGSLSHYERGRRQPDYKTLRRLADVFQGQMDYLLCRTDKPTADVESSNGVTATGSGMSDEQILNNFAIKMTDLNLSASDFRRMIECLRHFVR